MQINKHEIQHEIHLRVNILRKYSCSAQLLGGQRLLWIGGGVLLLYAGQK